MGPMKAKARNQRVRGYRAWGITLPCLPLSQPQFLSSVSDSLSPVIFIVLKEALPSVCPFIYSVHLFLSSRIPLFSCVRELVSQMPTERLFEPVSQSSRKTYSLHKVLPAPRMALTIISGAMNAARDLGHRKETGEMTTIPTVGTINMPASHYMPCPRLMTWAPG